MLIRSILVPLFWALACASAPPLVRTGSPPTAVQPSTGIEASVECGEVAGESPFKNPDATHVLLADFYGVGSNDQQFADTVATQIDLELTRFQEEELPGMPVHVPLESIEIQRLRCFLKSHAHAESVAAAVNADLVIWGRAYCNANPAVQQQIEIEQRVETGDIAADGNAKVTVGQVNVEAPKAYAVCPNATLHRSNTRLRKSSDKAIDIASLAHLDLPTLSAEAPFQLIHFTLGLHFYEREQPWIAVRFFERSVEHVLSPQDENLATLHLYLGRAFLELPGGAEKSIRYSESALQTEAGHGTAVEAGLLNNIGLALKVEGKYAEAIGYYEQALKIGEQALGKDHPTIASLLNNIGSALHAEGKYAEAIGYYERALKIDEQALGKDHTTTASLLNNLGLALHAEGKYAEAIGYYERALKIDEQALGKDQPTTASLLSNLGLALQAEGKYAEAASCYERALKIDELALGRDHPDTATDLNNIGSVLQAQGKYAEAVGYYERALEIVGLALGKDHPSTATLLNNIGSALQAQGKYTEAIGYYERALKIDEQALGKDHPSTARDLNNIGFTLDNQGKYAEAIGYYERALKIDEQALGKDHPTTAILLNNVGSALKAQGKHAEAVGYYERALEIVGLALGKDHPSTATLLNNLGLALQAQGRYAEAIDCHERALKIDEQALGRDHPSTATDLNSLGLALQAQGKYAEAIGYLRRARSIVERALGRDHPNIRTASRNLARAIAAASGRHDEARGPVVTEVLAGSQAAVLNLKLGDWVVEYGGVKVQDADNFGKLVRAKDSKAPVALVVVRDGKRLHIPATGGPLNIQVAD